MLIKKWKLSNLKIKDITEVIMKIKPRRMKKYTPRRRRSNKELQKQQLTDFEHLLNMDINSYLVLNEEGTEKQAEKAKFKARSHLMKYGADMEAIGRDLGQGLPEIIRNYIKVMRMIVQSKDNNIDPALINELRNEANRLKRQIKQEAA
jgi:hypothetical protein